MFPVGKNDRQGDAGRLQMNRSSVPFSSLELWHLVQEMPGHPTASQHSSQAERAPLAYTGVSSPCSLQPHSSPPFWKVLAHYFCFSRFPVEVSSCRLSECTHASPSASPHRARAQVPVPCVAVLSSFLEWDVSQCRVPEGIIWVMKILRIDSEGNKNAKQGKPFSWLTDWPENLHAPQIPFNIKSLLNLV